MRAIPQSESAPGPLSDAANGGFPWPYLEIPSRMLSCDHEACGTETRIRLPSAVPPSAVRRVFCERCQGQFEPRAVTEVGAEGRAVQPDPGSGLHRHTPRRTVGRAAGWLALACGLALALAVLVPALLGYHRFVITGDSMSGSYDRGSLLFSKEVPVSELRVGDVITYTPPPDAGQEGLVTHRIVSVMPRNGELVLHTQGDANEDPDPWRFVLDEPTQARAAFGIPYLGFGLAALAMVPVRMLLIGVPALLVALSLLVRLWRETGEEAERLRAAVAAGEAPGAALP